MAEMERARAIARAEEAEGRVDDVEHERDDWKAAASICLETIKCRQAKVEALRAERDELAAALGWFADEGHYTDTYRLGAGFVDALGLELARDALANVRVK